MGIALFLREYLLWHYGKALSDLFELCKNFFRFGYNFFSIPLLVDTWFSPLFRMKEEFDRDFTHFEARGAAILGNFVLRIAGFILRTIVITIGLLFEAITLVCSLCAFLIWILFPVVVVFLLIEAIRTLA